MAVMPIHKGTGVLVAVEGIDGAGKTTQLNLLAGALRAAGETVVTSKEPTDGPWGARIRASASTGRMSADDELEAFIKDRTEHVHKLIDPALEQGQIVLLDRYYYSTIAYQGSRGHDIGEIRTRMESLFPIPDAVLLLDLDPALAIYRIAEKRGDLPNEFEKVKDLEKARDVFNSMNDPRVIRVNGSDSVDTVHHHVIEAFMDGPLKSRRCTIPGGCEDIMYCASRRLHKCDWWRLKGLLSSSTALA